MRSSRTLPRLAILAALLATPCFAQQPSPFEQRIGKTIGALVIQNEGLQMQLEQAQEALKAAQDRVKALEAKYEPKPKKD